MAGCAEEPKKESNMKGNTAGKEVREEMKTRLMKLLRRMKKQDGQSLVEYALILALIAVVAILVLRGGIGTSVNNKLSAVNNELK
jgi:pilus assembly protein Flp/PilA